MHVFAWMVDILSINFEPLTLCCVLFVSSILVYDTIRQCVFSAYLCKCDRYKYVQSANIGVKCVTFVFETFTRYGSNITSVWQEIFTPMTLAFSHEVVHKKLWKSVNICKSYRKKISGTFFSGHGVHLHNRMKFCILWLIYASILTSRQSTLRHANIPIRKNGDSHPNLSSRTEPMLPVNNVLCKINNTAQSSLLL